MAFYAAEVTSPAPCADDLSHADIAVACCLCQTREAHPGLFDATRWPSLAEHAKQADTLDEFTATYQPFVVRLKD